MLPPFPLPCPEKRDGSLGIQAAAMPVRLDVYAADAAGNTLAACTRGLLGRPDMASFEKKMAGCGDAVVATAAVLAKVGLPSAVRLLDRAFREIGASHSTGYSGSHGLWKPESLLWGARG